MRGSWACLVGFGGEGNRHRSPIVEARHFACSSSLREPAAVRVGCYVPGTGFPARKRVATEDRRLSWGGGGGERRAREGVLTTLPPRREEGAGGCSDYSLVARFFWSSVAWVFSRARQCCFASGLD